ncbi:MAG: hypothetical protein IJM73_03850, partial [Spirochaetales bacterium]|nr:hypothetical protein [Spirochaetales bacterium]
MPDRINVGVDLHKTQFTICVLIDDEVVETGTVYRMDNDGFLDFTARMQAVSAENGNCEVRIAIESTANSRFFKEVMEKAGFR